MLGKETKMKRKGNPNGVQIPKNERKKESKKKIDFGRLRGGNRSTAEIPETLPIQQDTLQGNLHLNQQNMQSEVQC